ncbi:MAG: hypothetical protein GTO14_18680 [Anaerolineales bacterium]|nr:hypothetical protein [Anaerolineales bacterium]
MSREDREWHPVLDPSIDPRADRFTTTDWFLKLKETEKFLDRTTSQFLDAKRQIHEMNDVMGWLLKIGEMVYLKQYAAAHEWLKKAVRRFPWLIIYFHEKRISTDELISGGKSETSE